MSWGIIVIAVAAIAAGFAFLAWAIRYASVRGEERGRLNESAKRLAEEARRREEFDEKMAEPLDKSARDAWDRLVARRRRQRMPDGEGSE